MPPEILLLLCVFVAAVTFLPSRCLAPMGDTHVDTQNDETDLLITPLRCAQVP
jgi:hypothetical protein